MPRMSKSVRKGRAKSKKATLPRLIKHNKILTSVRGKPNVISTVRTLDYGIVDLASGKKHWELGGPQSAGPFNFPNFDITMMPNHSEWSGMFGRYKVNAIEIRLIPCYSYQQVLQQNDAPAGSFPGNTMSNILVTRISTKYDTSPNDDRFNATYAKDDVAQLDQFVKKKTTVMSTRDFKGVKCYTKHPRQVQPVVKSIDTESTVLENVPGKFNDFDAGGIQYVANDSLYIRNADSGRDLVEGPLRCRVIYKVYLELSGFQ